MLTIFGFACSMAGSWDADTATHPSLDSEGSDSSAADDTAAAEEDTAGASARVVITEIMVDPDAVSDDVGEWFEVLGTGSASVDLDGLVVTGDDGEGFTVEGSLELRPGARLVFANTADPGVNGGVSPDYVYAVDGLKLSNDGDSLALSLREELDTVAWGADWHLREGYALSLDPGASDNDDPAAWCTASGVYGAGDHGSPGDENPSCENDTSPPDDDADDDGVPDEDDCAPADSAIFPGADEVENGLDDDCDGWMDERAPEPGDLVVTEIMDDPDPTDDETGEWLELTSTTPVPLVLDGLTLSDADGELQSIATDTVLDSWGIVLLAASDDTSVNGGILPDLLFDRDTFHLANDEDEVILSFEGVLVDEVDYDADFPHDSGKSRSVDPAGATATRNDDPDWWCEGDGAYNADGEQGTPG